MPSIEIDYDKLADKIIEKIEGRLNRTVTNTDVNITSGKIPNGAEIIPSDHS